MNKLNTCISLIILILLGGILTIADSQIQISINSGNPAYPFPQFLPYINETDTLHNLATKNSPGLCHAEMEKATREAFQIMMNRDSYPGGGVGNTKYIYHMSDPSCTEGTGYAMLMAAIMADKNTFDGLWLWAHDNAMNRVNRYDNGQPTNSSDYVYSRLPGWTNKAGTNSAADGDFDMAMGLLIAYKQWGEFMGINDFSGKPISYKHDLVEFLKGMSDSLSFVTSNNKTLLSGDIGFDGYFKGGDTWQELTDWASRPTSPYNKQPTFAGGATNHVDYTCPGYFVEFARVLKELDPSGFAWNINQFERAAASSDWIMGKMYSQNPKNIPFAGWVGIKNDTDVTFSQFADGEDFRAGWRTVINRMWHGNPTSSWDPVNHSIIASKPNTFELDIGKRFARYLWDFRQSPWNLPGVKGNSGTYWGVSVVKYHNDIQGNPNGAFPLNWINGTGAPSAIVSQNMNLISEMYRFAEIEWDIIAPGDRYLTSVPRYFHDFFRVLGMTILTGNHQAPSAMKPLANMKVYFDVNKTFAFTGDTLIYTIDYRNYGSLDAQNVVILDTLPRDFIYVSSTGGGAIDQGTNIVTWNLGTVPGFKTSTGIGPTTGQVQVKVLIGKTTKKQYANRVLISCSNGYGWVANEFSNKISATFKRNLVDIANRALVIEKKAKPSKVNPGKDVTFSVTFSNSSKAGFLNGGRPGVAFSYCHNGTPAVSSTHKMRVRMFSDAYETYINYANYRVSYFMFDPGRIGVVGVNGNTTGWIVNPISLDGLVKENIRIGHQVLTPGSDAHGKWNQRIILQFSDPGNPTIPDTNWATMGTMTRFLEDQFGNQNRVHRGQTIPLRVEWDISTMGGVLTTWNDDWSWDPKAAQASSLDNGYPVTPDFTNPDPDNPGVEVRKLNPKYCDESSYAVNNVLIEEWDGYTWRRVFGNSPMPGREVRNVVVRDTIPEEFQFKAFAGASPMGIAPQISGNIISWSIPVLQINEGGTITYTATAKSIAPFKEKRVKNRAWIRGENESQTMAETEVTITTDSLPPLPPPPTSMNKIADKLVYFSKDTISYTIGYKQTHGSLVCSPTVAADWNLIAGSTKLPIDASGAISLSTRFTQMVHRYSYGVNGTVGANLKSQQYAEHYILLRQNGNDYIALFIKPESSDLFVKIISSGVVIDSGRMTYPGYPAPFDFKIRLNQDTLSFWAGDTLSPFPALLTTGLPIREGFAGIKVENSIGDILSNWHTNLDAAFNVSITDRLPYGIRLLSTGGKVVTGVLAGAGIVSQMKSDTIVWPIISGPDQKLSSNDSLYVTVKGIVDTSLTQYIVNTAYAQIHGYPRDSIGCQVISLFGTKDQKVKLVANPGSGDFTDSVVVTLAASSKDVTIYYTTNGSIPNPVNPGQTTLTYTKPIAFYTTTTLTAVACRNNTTSPVVSDTLTEIYNIKAGKPAHLTATPAGSSFTDSIRVSITSSIKDLSIYYTTDGSMPDPKNTGGITKPYTNPITIKKTTTLKAVACRNNTTSPIVSDTLVELYRLIEGEKAKLTATPRSCSFFDSVQVAISSSVKDLSIYYTTNGSIPDPKNVGSITQRYTAPIIIKQTTTLMALACRKDTVVASDTLCESYTRKEPPPTIDIQIAPNPSDPDKDTLPAFLRSKFKSATGIIIRIDPHTVAATLSSAISIFDPVGSIVAFRNDKNPDPPAIELYRDPKSNIHYLLWNCHTVNGRKVGYGSYLAIVDVTANNETRLIKRFRIGISRR